ncbi:MAG: hypothetical protein SGJ11_07425 [Phycisphaerae bacterium]|nr:hypothetical protein [Phycisphaerae bacterium]
MNAARQRRIVSGLAISGAVLTAASASAGERREAGEGPWVPLELCGQLVASPFCGIALATEDGSLWLLDDVGSFALGDTVVVSGLINLECVTIPECAVGACARSAPVLVRSPSTSPMTSA